MAEIAGGEVAITNLNSRGEEFWFQIRFSLTSEKREGKNPYSDQDVFYQLSSQLLLLQYLVAAST